jgi:hypothetical protein
MSRTSALTVALLVTVMVAPPAHGADERSETPRSKGFVDGSAFAGLVDDDATVVEVNLKGPLLQALSRIDTEKGGVGEFLRNLESITAYVVDLEGSEEIVGKATRMVRDVETRLDRAGWERLARVRERDESINVFVRNDEKIIDGLVVTILDRGERQVVFVNIAGIIDLARLAELGTVLSVPGLDAIGGAAVEKPEP